MAEKSKKTKKSGKPAFGGRIRKYFRDTASEFKKIVWPSWKQIRNNTVVVLTTVLIFAVVIWALDYGLGVFRGFILTKLTEIAAGGA